MIKCVAALIERCMQTLSDLHQLGFFKILIYVYAVILARNTMDNMTIREVRLNVFVF